MTVSFLLFIVLKQILLLELWKIPNTISFSKHCKSNFAWSHKPAVYVCECTHACMCVCVCTCVFLLFFPKRFFFQWSYMRRKINRKRIFLSGFSSSLACNLPSFTMHFWNTEIFDTPRFNLFFIGKHLSVV